MVASTALLLAGCTGSDQVERTGDDTDPTPSTTSDDGAEAGETDSATIAGADQESGPDTAVPVTVLEFDTEGELGAPLTAGSITQAPTGERYIEPSDDNRIVLALEELPPHESVTIVADLHIIGAWTGGDGGDGRWQMQAGGLDLLNTTFSHGDGMQAYPDDLTAGRFHPAGQDADQPVAPGFGVEAATTYRIERGFLHPDASLLVEFACFRCPEGDGSSWGIGSIEITTQPVADEAERAELGIEVDGEAVRLTGRVPTETDRQRLLATFDDRYYAEVTDELIVIGPEAPPPPLWLYQAPRLARLAEPFGRLRIDIADQTATLRGEVSTQVWADSLVIEVGIILDSPTTVVSELDLHLDPSVVEGIETSQVRFATGSSQLDGAAESILADIADGMATEEDVDLWITGHTDTEGSEGDNRNLAAARAEAVADHLILLGVDPGRLDVRSRGETRPEVAEASDEDRALNRRVTFLVGPG